MCQEAGINACLGGTLLEIAAYQGRTDDYVRWMHRLGLEHVEVSNGALDMSAEKKQELIRELSGEFRVISEVGSKSPLDPVVAEQWVLEMQGDLEAGASCVIAEGRESGTVGMFESTGEVRADLAESLVEAIPATKIIFEAPRKSQQAWFIRRFGPDANLGNIPADEVLSLETLRRGLRADTLDILPELVENPLRTGSKKPASRWPPGAH
jgi:phosphosulfolactate synthase